MNPYSCVTPEQKAAEAAYKSLISDHSKADSIYDALAITQGGMVISTDFARYLDFIYAKDPLPGKPRDLAPSWNHAWRYAQDRLMRELTNRRGRAVVRFMSGGWGAGKTHALESLKKMARAADLVWDGTLSEYSWARMTIQMALDKGWNVVVFHVHRNVELALYGAIERGKKEGRNVPLKALPTNHRQVQDVVLKLLRKFHNHPQFAYYLVHNTGTAEVPGQGLMVTWNDVAFRGALHYTAQYEIYHAKAADQIHV